MRIASPGARFRAIYLSGDGSVSAGSPGLPDLDLLAMDGVLTDIRRGGHQRNVVDTLQTREELYERIGYHTFEQRLDRTFAAKKQAPHAAGRCAGGQRRGSFHTAAR